MLKTLIDKEIERLSGLGFDCIVSEEDITIDKAFYQLALGNDSYILKGIYVSATDIVENRTKVSIISATNSLSGTQQEISAKGIHRLLHEYIIIKTQGISSEVSPYSLQFVKLSPTPKL